MSVNTQNKRSKRVPEKNENNYLNNLKFNLRFICNETFSTMLSTTTLHRRFTLKNNL